MNVRYAGTGDWFVVAMITALALLGTHVAVSQFPAPRTQPDPNDGLEIPSMDSWDGRLSDGTQLTDLQLDVLRRGGRVILPDGQVIMHPGFRERAVTWEMFVELRERVEKLENSGTPGRVPPVVPVPGGERLCYE